MHDTFRFVVFFKPGSHGSLTSELSESGYPLARASSPSDALKKFAEQPGFLITDDAGVAALGDELRTVLAQVARPVPGRVIVLSDTSTWLPGAAMLPCPGANPTAEWFEAFLAELTLNQRAAPRADVDVEAWIVTTEDATIEGRISSLSETGAFFTGSALPPIATSGLLSMNFADETRTVLATVVNTRDNGVGIRFDDAGEANRAAFRAIVGKQLGTQKSPRTVLVFDTSRVARKLAAFSLTQWGYDVHTHDSLGGLVRELASSPAPAAVIVDPTQAPMLDERLPELIRRVPKTTALVLSSSLACEQPNHLRKGAFSDVFAEHLSSIIR